MRLKKIWISEYKNLKDFKFEFGDDFLDIFTGKNGSGKSNFFEAIIHIFNHLFARSEPILEYEIEYELNKERIKISCKDNQLTFNDENVKNIPRTSLPENLLVYYSGHNLTVKGLIKSYEADFQTKIKSANLQESRSIVGIGPEYKELLLAMLLIHSKNNPAREYICKKLDIKNISKEVKLELKRPFYALRKIKFNMEDPRGEDSYWKAEGITKVFLNKLKDCLSQSEEIREEGYISKDDKYVLYYDIQKIQSVFRESSLGELFQGFDNLKTINMLSGISIPIELQGGGEADISFFSDGQFQSVYIYAIAEFFKDRHCLTLLDEPDSFLHPEWQSEFLKQIDDISNHDISRNHILLSSHSAATLVGHSLNQKNQKISFFDLNNNKEVKCYPLGKFIAVQKLCNKVISYIEQQSVLSIIQEANDPKKPVLLVEGLIDVVIIQGAWRKLFEVDIPFAILNAHSCTLLPVILKSNDLNFKMAVFGLFDFDKAFSHWNGLAWDCIEQDPLKGLIRKNKEKEIYAFMLPIPDHEAIKRQAINKDKSSEYFGTYGDKTCCTIEHLFYCEETKKYFKEESVSGGGSHIKFNGDKKGFAEKVIPSLDKSYFEIFRPLFEFVMSKCPDEEKKKFTQSYLQSQVSDSSLQHH